MTRRYRKVGVNFANTRNIVSISALSPGESKEFLDARLGIAVQEDINRMKLVDIYPPGASTGIFLHHKKPYFGPMLLVAIS